MKPESAAFAASYLRDADRDRYLSTLVLVPPHREAVTALYAFAADLAAVRERAREPAAGEIRLQWWADALTGSGHGAVLQNPLADALLYAVAEHGLPVPALTRMIEARRFDLYDDPMPDLASFEGYAGETSSVLYQLAGMILNGGALPDGDAAGHLGVAHALIGHLRAFGFNASRGRIVLPQGLLRANGVSAADVTSGRESAGLTQALEQIAEIADDHIAKAGAAIGKLPKQVRPVFSPIALLSAQRRLLSPTTPFTPPRDLPDWRKIAVLSWWRLKNS